ncbi:protein sym-1 [Telopea speciosissima]|uniref:protein sym-1 n=1 Tax=Telopea speciosissima TaxID=54955 RepID=UPI001CC6D214|nr:protein sym-1 [Telopea speciosissima]XP_043717310.1 protein sym-1 [Telopea speciosissima]XP_043717311.1 protein sym-1 [Telopea speciosissima]XP_043717312.1 protein sym-1 [Telopea speciosissima]XP_043717313.1 protein sym-1 [Telopea speciosissima]
MAVNLGTIIRRSPSLARSIIFNPKPVSPFRNLSRIATCSATRSGFRVCSSCFIHTPSINSYHRTGFKDLGLSGMKIRDLGLDYFRVSAVSGGGGVGGTGGFGGQGDGNSGGRGDDGGGSNWSLLSWYLAVLEKYPVFTKAVTSALLTFVGDLICQLWIDQVSTLDLKRTFLFTLLGFVLVGPTLHFWYLYLSKLVTVPGASGALLRLLLDQFLFSPIFIGVFLSVLVTLEGRPSEVVPKLQQEWFSAVLANWQLWIPFQFLNFRFVPQQFQVLVANVVALAWNVILSFKAHKEVLVK